MKPFTPHDRSGQVRPEPVLDVVTLGRPPDRDVQTAAQERRDGDAVRPAATVDREQRRLERRRREDRDDRDQEPTDDVQLQVVDRDPDPDQEDEVRHVRRRGHVVRDDVDDPECHEDGAGREEERDPDGRESPKTASRTTSAIGSATVSPFRRSLLKYMPQPG
jgi:hypothetical protein